MNKSVLIKISSRPTLILILLRASRLSSVVQTLEKTIEASILLQYSSCSYK